MLSSLAADTTMDVDSPSTESGAGTEPPAATSASDAEIKTPAGNHPTAPSDSSGAPSEDNMVLDPPTLPTH